MSQESPSAASAGRSHEAEQELDYAAKPPLRRRRWVARLLVCLALLVALAVGVIWYGPPIARRWDALAGQRRFFNHTIPPRTVLVAQPADATQQSVMAAWKTRKTSRAMNDWHAYSLNTLKLLPQGNELLFLHKRTSSGGNRRLIGITFRDIAMPEGISLAVIVRVIRPGTLFGASPQDVPVPETGSGRGQLYRSWKSSGLPHGYGQLFIIPFGTAATLYAGRADPNDASAFLIDYVYDGRPGTIVGRLHDDDSITFEGLPPDSPTIGDLINRTATRPAP